MCFQIIYLIYMYKQDLALYNLQWLIIHKSNQPKELQAKNIYQKIARVYVAYLGMWFTPFPTVSKNLFLKFH